MFTKLNITFFCEFWIYREIGAFWEVPVPKSISAIVVLGIFA
jgi:hypothetical protein